MTAPLTLSVNLPTTVSSVLKSAGRYSISSWIPWNFRYIHWNVQFTPKMKANAELCLLSSLVWIDSGVVVSQHRLESFFMEWNVTEWQVSWNSWWSEKLGKLQWQKMMEWIKYYDNLKKRSKCNWLDEHRGHRGPRGTLMSQNCAPSHLLTQINRNNTSRDRQTFKWLMMQLAPSLGCHIHL